MSQSISTLIQFSWISTLALVAEWLPITITLPTPGVKDTIFLSNYAKSFFFPPSSSLEKMYNKQREEKVLTIFKFLTINYYVICTVRNS